MPDVNDVTTQNGLPSQEEVDAILADVSEPQAPEEILLLKTDEERAVASRILPLLAAKANARAEANRARQLNETIDQLKSQNKEMIEAELNKLRESAKPPNLEEIEKILNQDYITINFKVKDRKGNRVREFSIQELPQQAEERFLKVIRQAILPRLKEFAAVEWTNTNTTAERLQRILDMFPEMLETMAELASVSLDPFQENEEINKEWVQANLGSYRILMVIQAQVEAGKFRDFFLAAFRAIPSQMMA